VLSALAIVIAVALLGRPMAFAVSVGALLMALNAWVLRRLGVRAFKTFTKPGAAILLFNLKMGALIALVFLIIHYLHVDPVGFVIGISVFPVAIVVVAIRHMLSGGDEGNQEGTPNG
jgi:hypothetical protein